MLGNKLVVQGNVSPLRICVPEGGGSSSIHKAKVKMKSELEEQVPNPDLAESKNKYPDHSPLCLHGKVIFLLA